MSSEENEVAQHGALTQLDQWIAEAEVALGKKAAGSRPVGGMSEQQERVREEVVTTHGVQVDELLLNLRQEKSDIERQIELDGPINDDEARAVSPELDAIDDAIFTLENYSANGP